MTTRSGIWRGKDVIIDFDNQNVQVRVVTGGLFHRRETWMSVGRSFALNSYYSRSVETAYGRFFFRDLPLTLVDVAHGFGTVYVDGERAAAIFQAPEALRGEKVAIDIAGQELAFAETALVFPFSCMVHIIDGEPPCFQERHPLMGSGVWPLKGLPIGGRELAARMGLSLVAGP